MFVLDKATTQTLLGKGGSEATEPIGKGGGDATKPVNSCPGW